MPRRFIQSLDVRGLEPYRTLRRPLEHIQKGIFVAEGEKVVRRLLDSPLKVVSLLLTPEWLDRYETSGKLSGTHDIFIAPKELLETIVGYNLHQGIMAVGKVPPDPTLERVIASHDGRKLFAAIDGLVNAENVGVVVRNCAAFGVDAVIAGETSSSPYLRRAVRNSMGTVFTLPILHVGNLADERAIAGKILKEQDERDHDAELNQPRTRQAPDRRRNQPDQTHERSCASCG